MSPLSLVLLFLSNQFYYCATTKMEKIEIISESLEVGTRPHWDSQNKCLYYVDVPTSYAYKYVPNTGRIYKTKTGDAPLAFMFPANGTTNKFVAGLGRNISIITWDGKSPELQNLPEILQETDSELNLSGNRLNGGKVDPDGILWAGSMGPQNISDPPRLGSLFSFKGQEGFKKHLSNIGISNGLAWNKSLRKMYYIDTQDPRVYAFDYDKENNEISNRTVAFEFEKHLVPGQPDGLTIDNEGKLWVACIYGSRIIRVDPDGGNLLKTIILPTPQITALTFGGPKLDILYVTSAKMEVNGTVPPYPAGCTFSVENCGVRGVGDTSFKL